MFSFTKYILIDFNDAGIVKDVFNNTSISIICKQAV